MALRMITSERQRRAMFAHMAAQTQRGYRVVKQKRRGLLAGVASGTAVAVGLRVARAPLSRYGFGLAQIYGVGYAARMMGRAKNAVIHNVAARRYARAIRNPRTVPMGMVYGRPGRIFKNRIKVFVPQSTV